MEKLTPIPGFQRDEARHVAFVRWHRSWPAIMFLAALWNFVMPQLPFVRAPPPLFLQIGMIAGVVFLLLAFRSLAARTRITLDSNGLDVRNAWAPWSKVHVALSDIQTFEVLPHPHDGHTNIAVRLRSGDVRELPIDWQPVPITWKGSRKRWLVADASCASWLTRELEDMLIRARQLGHDTFRT